MTKDGKASLAAIAEKINKEFGKGSALVLGSGAEPRGDITDVIPLRVGPIDNYVLGVGGLACGRIYELYSEEGSGKSSLLYQALGSVQMEDGLAALQETESALQVERLAVFGVDPSRLLIGQPGTMEEALQQIELILQSAPRGGSPILIGWDSVAATPTADEVKEGVADGTRDMRAKILSAAFRQIVPLCAEKHAVLVCINQVRDKIGVMFGDKSTTPGGHAIKFAASVRLQILGGAAIKVRDRHVGKDVTVIASKNKLAPPWRKCRLRLMYETGFDDEWSTLEFAKDAQVIEQDATGPEALREAREKLAKIGWDPTKATQEMLVAPEASAKRRGEEGSEP